MKKNEKRLHVIPLGDTADHEASLLCWCIPLDNRRGLVTHNANDCREQMERSGMPTGKIWCRIAETACCVGVTSRSEIISEQDPIALLRRIGTKGAFMDLEGLRIIASDFIAKWDETFSSQNSLLD